MVYTNSVRLAVCRRIFREKLGIDDVAFEALCDQEVARREEEQKEMERKQLEDGKKQALEAAVEEAKAQSVPEAQVDETVAEIETCEFGGDFGEEKEPDGGEPAGDGEPAGVDSEAGDSAPLSGAAEDDAGAVGDAGQDPDGVQRVAGSGEEGQPADPV